MCRGWVVFCALALSLSRYGAAISPSCSVTPAEAADTVLLNGHFLTLDAMDTVAGALAVKDGRITAVGSNSSVKRRMGKRTRVIDLHGRTATPGLIDTHAHFDMTRLLYDLDLSDLSLKEVADVVRKVEERVTTLKPGEWVRGKGWDERRLTERRYLYAADLDRVAPNNPVYLEHVSPRLAVVNSYALRLAGLTRDTSDPANGIFDRLPDGNLSGILRQTAVDRVRNIVPPHTPAQMRSGLLKAIEEFNKEGITAVKDPMMFDPQGKWDRYRRLSDEGKLTIRVFALWTTEPTVEAAGKLIERIKPFTRPAEPAPDARLISGGVKLLFDGSALGRTAWMHEDFNRNFRQQDAGNRGITLITPEVYRQLVRLYHNAGLHIGTHAIGDRAIDWVVDTYSEVLEGAPTRGLRHAIIHCHVPTDPALDAMAALQKRYDAGYPEIQATFMWWTGDTVAGNFGPQRSLRVMPFNTFAKRGIRWSGGSDYAVTPYPARYGIWASVRRKPLQGEYGSEPFGTAESASVRQALRSYTSWAARQLFLEKQIGTLEPGKEADIAIWDCNPYTVTTDKLKDMKCEMTLLHGRVVHRAPGTPIHMR